MSADSKHILLIHAIKHNGRLLELPLYERRIEFIGDSITSGEGAIGDISEQDWVSMWFSATENYTRYTANVLNAEYRVVSQSGWGVYSSWDHNTDYNIPSYYEQVCGLLGGKEQLRYGAKQPYRFSVWQPNIIIVNLGTNDASAYRLLKATTSVTEKELKAFLTAFEKAIYSFIGTIRKNNPSSKIVWAYGMLGDDLVAHIVNTIEVYQLEQHDTNVYYCKLPIMDKASVGSRQHPGKKSHIEAANVLASFIKRIDI